MKLTDEEMEEFIKEWLEKHKELMESLAKSEEEDKKNGYSEKYEDE